MAMLLARLVLSVTVVMLAGGCADPRLPTSPSTPPTSPPSASSPRPAPEFPAVTRPARVFDFARSLDYPVTVLTVGSRVVLYDDGKFALQYLYSQGLPEYGGTYAENEREIRFKWDGWSIAGEWGATGSLDGEFLTIRYNLIMALSDFEDAVYVWRR